MDKFLIKKIQVGENNTTEINKNISRPVNDSSSSSIKNNSDNPSKKFKGNYRIYNENYLKMGIHWVGDEDCPLPFCVICEEKLSNESMVPNKLERHFKTKHQSLALASKQIDLFESF